MAKNTIVIPEEKIEDGLYIGGEYQHYKGNHYKIIGICHHSETLEKLVVYQALYDDCLLWVRPLEMFKENVEWNGQNVPRFLYLGKK
jgi:hypothetical protein